MNPKDYGLPHWAKLSNLKPLTFEQLITQDIIDWMAKPEPQWAWEHTCGCGYPNAAPPCWHCTDCTDCMECEYCDEDHAGPEECPALTDPIGYTMKKDKTK